MHQSYGKIRPERKKQQKRCISPQKLKKMGIIERIIPEYGGASSETVDKISFCMKKQIRQFLLSMSHKTAEELVKERYERFRRM